MLLSNKVAVIYGAAGAIGSATARAFAAEGARLFLTGRRLDPVASLAAEIVAGGGSAVAAQVDALDEEAVDEHLHSVVDSGRPHRRLVQRHRGPRRDGAGSSARRGGRRAVPAAHRRLHAVVLPHRSSGGSLDDGERVGRHHRLERPPLPNGQPRLNGGYGPAQAAKEAMTRDLSAELAPHGIRVVALRPHGLPETRTMRHLHEAKGAGTTWEQFEQFLSGSTHPRRVLRVDEVANVAAFVASDPGGGLTGTTSTSRWARSTTEAAAAAAATTSAGSSG